jgi:glutamyl-tRNA synthetase
MENTVRTRFAPSPTGYLHVGGARTALFNWLYARKNNGVFVLRIEDTDKERSTAEATEAILRGMQWLGLNWDEGPYFQSERLALYDQYFDKLLANKAAYEKDGAVYFRSTDPAGLIEDFVIKKSDGNPVYNFAVVIDDALMKITHIIRGDDHLSNTPRQIMIYKALGLEIPKLVHVPMILGPDGQRLSKRHGATSVEEYAKLNILPEAMINYLARLGWAYKDQEFFTVADLIDKFSLNKVGKSPAIFDQTKLEWLNGEHIKAASPERLKEFLPENYRNYPDIEKILKLGQSRMKNIEQVIAGCKYYIENEITIDPELQQQFLTKEKTANLKLLPTVLENSPWDEKNLEAAVRETAEANKLQPGDLIHPLRVAVTGTNVSPGIFEVLALLGKTKTIQRIKNATN